MSDFDKTRMRRRAQGSLLDFVPAAASTDAARPSSDRQFVKPPVRPGISPPELRGYRQTAAPGGIAATPLPRRQSLGDHIAELMRRDSEHALPEAGPAGNAPVIAQSQPAEPQARSVQHAQAPLDNSAADQPAAPIGLHDDRGDKRFEFGTALSAVLRYRRRIGVAMLTGACAGLLLAQATPHRFHAETRLFIDPRGMQRMAGDIGDQSLSTETMLAVTDGQVRVLSSTSLLSKVVEQLGLARDAEFNGGVSKGGLSAGIAVIRDILTKTDSSAEPGQGALARLRQAVSVTRDPSTFIINVGVDSLDPQKAALIANRIVQTYLDGEGRVQSELVARATDQFDSRIKAKRTELEAAENAVERFKAENGIAGEVTADQPILVLREQLATIRARKAGIQAKADSLAGADLDGMVSGAFPDEFLSPTMVDLRRQYSLAKTRADSLAASLGPLHPQYIAGQSALESIRGEIRRELHSIVAASQTELQRTVQTEQELAQQMAVAKVQSLDKSVDYAALRDLERKAAAARESYEALLNQSRAASEAGNLTARKAQVISEAEPSIEAAGFSRWLLAAAGAMAGLFAALATALATAVTGGIRTVGSPEPRARVQPPSLASPPLAPASVPGVEQLPQPTVARQRRKDDDDSRGISGEDAVRIHAEVMRAAATPRAAASVAPVEDAKAENESGNDIAYVGVDEAAMTAAARAPVAVPAAKAENAAPSRPRAANAADAVAARPMSVQERPETVMAQPMPMPDEVAAVMAPPMPMPVQRQPEAARQPQPVQPGPQPAATAPYPDYPHPQPYPAAVMPDPGYQQFHPQPQSHLQPQFYPAMAHAQQMPPHYLPQLPQLPPQAFWPPLQPGWMWPQGFVPQQPQWPQHFAGLQMMPQPPQPWPMPHPAVYWQAPVPATSADMAQRPTEVRYGRPSTETGSAPAEPQHAVTAGNVHAFDDIRRDLDRLGSQLDSDPGRRSA